MKAFVVAALLVASVASFDLTDLTTMDKSMFKYNKPTHTIEDLLMKEKMMGYNNLNFNIFGKDWTSVYGQQQVTILSLEGLVSHPLFREYMQIPLFRQFWEQYPTVFRRYVESPLFQQFWTKDEFQMYFRNPIFFYKYIVPQVQMMSQNMYPTTTEGIYNNYETTPSWYNAPYVTKNQMYPTTYGYNFPYTTTSTNGLKYKYLLEKMYNHMYNNKMMPTETFTDVKMLPTGKVQEQTFGKIVDPITGEEKITFGDYKTAHQKIVPVEMTYPFVGQETKYPTMENIFGQYNTETIKDVLLKHIILNKIFGEKKVMTPSIYQTLFNKEVMTPELYQMISNKVVVPEMFQTVFGDNKKVLTPETIETLFNNNKMTPEIFDWVFQTKKHIITPELYEVLVGKNTMTPEVIPSLETIFGKTIYNPEIRETLFGGEQTTDLYNNDVYKYKMMNPLINKMLRNKMINKFNKNKMDMITLKKIQTEKMIEEIQKEKMMKELIKNQPIVDTEYPKMMETEKYHHVPLTFGTPVFEKFEDKEIKDNKF